MKRNHMAPSFPLRSDTVLTRCERGREQFRAGAGRGRSSQVRPGPALSRPAEQVARGDLRPQERGAAASESEEAASWAPQLVAGAEWFPSALNPQDVCAASGTYVLVSPKGSPREENDAGGLSDLYRHRTERSAAREPLSAVSLLADQRETAPGKRERSRPQLGLSTSF